MNELEPQPSLPAGLTFVHALPWEHVKQIWKNDEDTDTFRREYAEQGYESWEAWRKIIIDPLHLDTLEWASFTIDDVAESVPRFRGGPFKPWEDMYYGGKKTPTFAEIIDVEGTDVRTRQKFADINTSDKPVQLIGLLKDGEVYIVEGMHRSTAITLAYANGQSLQRPVSLLLAKSDLAEFVTID